MPGHKDAVIKPPVRSSGVILQPHLLCPAALRAAAAALRAAAAALRAAAAAAATCLVKHGLGHSPSVSHLFSEEWKQKNGNHLICHGRFSADLAVREFSFLFRRRRKRQRKTGGENEEERNTPMVRRWPFHVRREDFPRIYFLFSAFSKHFGYKKETMRKHSNILIFVSTKRKPFSFQ